MPETDPFIQPQGLSPEVHLGALERLTEAQLDDVLDDRRFYEIYFARIAAALQERGIPTADMSAEELESASRELEAETLRMVTEVAYGEYVGERG